MAAACSEVTYIPTWKVYTKLYVCASSTICGIAYSFLAGVSVCVCSFLINRCLTSSTESGMQTLYSFSSILLLPVRWQLVRLWGLGSHRSLEFAGP